MHFGVYKCRGKAKKKKAKKAGEKNRKILLFFARITSRCLDDPNCQKTGLKSVDLQPGCPFFAGGYCLGCLGICCCRVQCLKVVNQMSYLTVGSLENTSRLVDVSLNWTINSTG